jgi:hypothetical protein
MLASFRMSQQDRTEAIQAVGQAVRLWLPHAVLVKHAPVFAAMPENTDLQPIPSYPERLALTKVLMELRLYDLAMLILAELQEEDDEVVEMWMLFGMSYWCLGSDKIPSVAQLVDANDDEERQKQVEVYVQSVLEEQQPLVLEAAIDWHNAKECLDEALRV